MVRTWPGERTRARRCGTAESHTSNGASPLPSVVVVALMELPASRRLTVQFASGGSLDSREPLPLPKLRLRRRPPSIFEYDYEDFEFVNYQHHAAIAAPVAV